MQNLTLGIAAVVAILVLLLSWLVGYPFIGELSFSHSFTLAVLVFIGLIFREWVGKIFVALWNGYTNALKKSKEKMEQMSFTQQAAFKMGAGIGTLIKKISLTPVAVIIVIIFTQMTGQIGDMMTNWPLILGVIILVVLLVWIEDKKWRFAINLLLFGTLCYFVLGYTFSKLDGAKYAIIEIRNGVLEQDRAITVTEPSYLYLDAVGKFQHITLPNPVSPTGVQHDYNIHSAVNPNTIITISCGQDKIRLGSAVSEFWDYGAKIYPKQADTVKFELIKTSIKNATFHVKVCDIKGGPISKFANNQWKGFYNHLAFWIILISLLYLIIHIIRDRIDRFFQFKQVYSDVSMAAANLLALLLLWHFLQNEIGNYVPKFYSWQYVYGQFVLFILVIPGAIIWFIRVGILIDRAKKRTAMIIYALAAAVVLGQFLGIGSVNDIVTYPELKHFWETSYEYFWEGKQLPDDYGIRNASIIQARQQNNHSQVQQNQSQNQNWTLIKSYQLEIKGNDYQIKTFNPGQSYKFDNVAGEVRLAFGKAEFQKPVKGWKKVTNGQSFPASQEKLYVLGDGSFDLSIKQ